MTSNSERELLYGVIALQLNFVNLSQLVEALRVCSADEGGSLPAILRSTNAISPENSEIVDTLVSAKLNDHDDDPTLSLAALSTVSPGLPDLTSCSDPDVRKYVSTLVATRQPADPETQPHEGDGFGNANGEAPTIPRPDEPSPATAPWDGTPTLVDTSSPGRTGPRRTTSIGIHLSVLRFHKRGGIGEVYLARDEELGREVAIKQIRPEYADSADYRSRFLLEAEITSNLQHPGVIPVHGVGSFSDGRPYYVMRFVEGDRTAGDTLADAIAQLHKPKGPLDPATRAFRLRELLGRFVDVCEAIAYAHSKGVLHRDLKPANVLLGKYGETLLIDWGLAKTTGRSNHDSSLFDEHPMFVPSSGSHPPTMVGQKLGTPGYMSPEQARGEVDTLTEATDIYSLGGILYCILAGRSPVRGASQDEILRKVVDGEIEPPRTHRPDVPRPLQAICLKALATAPGDRYGSAQALADDVNRWMGDQPVAAYPEPLLARVARWGRHHRSFVVGTGAVLGVAVLGLSIGLWAVGREQKKTEEHFKAARELAAKLVETAEQKLAQIPGQFVPRRELFETALAQYERLADERPGDPDLLRETGMVHFYLANVLRLLNKSDDSDSQFGRAVDRFEAALVLKPRDPALRDRLAETFRDRGLLANRLGKLGDAKRLLDRSLTLARELRQESPESVEYRRTEAYILLNAAEIEWYFGRDQEALKLASEAVDRYAELSGKPDITSSAGRTIPQFYLAARNQHAWLLCELGRPEEALEIHEAALVQAIALVNQEKTLDVRFQHGKTLTLYGKSLARVRGREKDAEARLVAAQSMLDDLITENLPSFVVREREWVALAHQALASVRSGDRAIEELKRSRARLQEVVEKASSVPRYSWELGLVIDDMARAERQRGQEATARKLEQQAVASLRNAVKLAPETVPFRRDLVRIEARIAAKPRP